MKTFKIAISILLSLSLALFVACGGEGDDDPVTLEQSDAVSDCGGFPATRAPVFDDYPGDYCDAEVLHWEYDATNQKLDLRNSRILLNCCGMHGMEVQFEDGVYVVTETDEPEMDGGRCDCMCVFDYDLSATGVPGGVITVQLMRHVTDSGAAYQVLETELDLAEGSGFVVIDDSPEEWCGLTD